MERAKYAVRNSLGQYAGAGSNVVIQLVSGETVKGRIKSVQFASIVTLEGFVRVFNVTDMVDFKII